MTSEMISTARLRLRSPIQSDLKTLYQQIFADAEVMRFVLGGAPFTIDRAAEFFASAFDHEETGFKLGVLVEKENEEIVGFSGLMESHALGQKEYEIGFVLSRSAWGKGFATEIGQGQLRYGFEVAGCSRLLAQVAAENVRSVAALERIGMSFHSGVVTEGRGPRQIYVAYRPA
jgi:[ribosomal protein S5]-alanine N-acetyltransferase